LHPYSGFLASIGETSGGARGEQADARARAECRAHLVRMAPRPEGGRHETPLVRGCRRGALRATRASACRLPRRLGSPRARLCPRAIAPRDRAVRSDRVAVAVRTPSARQATRPASLRARFPDGSAARGRALDGRGRSTARPPRTTLAA
jgi:hypothetical protein